MNLRSEDMMIINEKEEDIETEMDQQNVWDKLHSIFMHNSSNDIKIAF